jgi:hypothetical protein
MATQIQSTLWVGLSKASLVRACLLVNVKVPVQPWKFVSL